MHILIGAITKRHAQSGKTFSISPAVMRRLPAPAWHCAESGTGAPDSAARLSYQAAGEAVPKAS